MLTTPQRVWFDRTFAPGTPIESFPEILERLRGTPARVEERVHRIPIDVLRRRHSDRWSIQEHVGHFTRVERLWITRIREYLRGETALTAADMSNTSTEKADFNRATLGEILETFREVRGETMHTLDPLSLEDAARTAHHPRLGVEMRLVDLCTFMAEHDDHHLAMIQAELRELRDGG